MTHVLHLSTTPTPLSSPILQQTYIIMNLLTHESVPYFLG